MKTQRRLFEISAALLLVTFAPESFAVKAFSYQAVDRDNRPVFDIRLITSDSFQVTNISGVIYDYNSISYTITGLVPPNTSFASPNQLFPNGSNGSTGLVNRDGITWYIDFSPFSIPWGTLGAKEEIFRWRYNPFDGDTFLQAFSGGPSYYGLRVSGGEVSIDGVNDKDGDVPLPAWAVLSLAIALMGMLKSSKKR